MGPSVWSSLHSMLSWYGYAVVAMGPSVWSSLHSMLAWYGYAVVAVGPSKTASIFGCVTGALPSLPSGGRGRAMTPFLIRLSLTSLWGLMSSQGFFINQHGGFGIGPVLCVCGRPALCRSGFNGMFNACGMSMM